jgi:hypothetical protein
MLRVDIYLKGISNIKLKENFEPRMKKFDKKWEMRYVDFPIPSGINVFRDKILLLEWGEKPLGILIKSKQIADTYRKLFFDIWKKGTT